MPFYLLPKFCLVRLMKKVVKSFEVSCFIFSDTTLMACMELLTKSSFSGSISVNPRSEDQQNSLAKIIHAF